MDDTATIRRKLAHALNATPAARALLEAHYGRVWDPAELEREFSVIGFAAPFVVVRRRSDRVRGSLLFQHSPRFYFAFTPG